MIYRFQPFEPSAVLKNHLKLGGENKNGERIDVTSLYLTRGGRPWIGVMGEYHFVRDDRGHWYEELCKMRAGGVTIVATYVFWIYHEEEEGVFDFTGDRDLRTFVSEATRAGLDVMLRIGPWGHGECRNGAFPDWLLKKPFALRENNDAYLALVRRFYEAIYEQVKGLFYRDGGPIIGIQVENELTDNAEHLLTLKKLAQEIGFLVPLYTVTGWNSKYGAKVPVDEVLPVFAAYPDAPWADTIETLPPNPHYVFDPNRNDAAVGMDILKSAAEDGWRLPYERYPFATCELGAGLPFTHHRRAIVDAMDAYALSLVKLGSGNNLIGYYMYHGGTNKIGKRSTLQESKATGYPNDYPILNYDFHTALTQYGEVREQYRYLNLLHLFVQDFGALLAPMEYVASTDTVQPDDTKSLRYAMRTDGNGGFVFVNHYQRLLDLEDLSDVTIDTGTVTFPPIDVKGKIAFFFPFRIPLGEEFLEYATAQLLCKEGNTFFFVAIPEILPRFRFAGSKEFSVTPDRDCFITVGSIRIVVLPYGSALLLRRLSQGLFLGAGVDLYEADGEIKAVQPVRFSYDRFTPDGYVGYVREEGGEDLPCAELFMEDVEEPFLPPYAEELNLGGERRRFWKRVSVTAPEGFVEFFDECDAAQLYASGELVADCFFSGEPWRVPAKLLYGKECFLVMSELRADFYREK